MMAGEIGAYVIVVKEVEVPPELSSLAESQLERWDGRRSTSRKDKTMIKQDASPTMSSIEFETELSSTDITDAEETTCSSPSTPPTSPGDSTQFSPLPTPFPFDPALAMFTMHLGEDIADYADNETRDGDVTTDFVTEFSVSLEISSVYKPRPMKKRATHIASPPLTHFEHAKKKIKNGYPPSKSTDTTCHTGDPIAQDSFEILSQPKGAKAQLRRDKRDKQRELKHNAPLTHVPMRRSTELPTNSTDHHTVPSCSTNSSAFESLHIAVVDPAADDASATITMASEEPRLIVEALVVWELSLDEAFLDFEGFSLQ